MSAKASKLRPPPFLPSGTILDQYIVERALANGGFSLVYLARQLRDQSQVAIKEYLPKRLAHRTRLNHVVPADKKRISSFQRGRRLFIEEAKVLSRIKHHNIVQVLNYFTANSTSYLVMSFDYGKTLSQYLKKHKKPVDEEFINRIFPMLLDGVQSIHDNNLLHLDIKPENILIRGGDDPLLLDFGAAQPFPVVDGRKFGRVLTRGYSPGEQYKTDGNVGPWSDIYAIAATMRMCIEGKAIPPSTEREKSDTLRPAVVVFKRQYSNGLLQAIDAGLELKPENRPQSIEEYLSIIHGA
ncbi:MAG: serine/threonine-protein kinase [Methylococcales bacterium]